MSIATFPSQLMGATALDVLWQFERMSPIANDRSDDDERFPIENRVECSMRELLQNLLDCGATLARLVFRKIHVSQLKAAGFDELEERIIGIDGYEYLIDEEGFVSCLEVIDDGSGLGGDYRRAPGIGKPGGLQAYARGTGNSSKGHGNSGSKGVGRTAVMASGTLRCVLVLTQPEPSKNPSTNEAVTYDPLAFGLVHLDFHTFRGAEYKGTGRLMKPEFENGEKLLIPYVGEEALDFARKLDIVRTPGAKGTTQLFPSIRPEFTPVSVVTELVKNHFVAVLTRRLEIVVEGCDNKVMRVDSSTILDLASDPAFGGSASLAGQVKLVKSLLDMRGSAVDIGTAKGRLSEEDFDQTVLDGLKQDFTNGLPVAVTVSHVIRQRRGPAGQPPSSGRLFHACVASPDTKGCDISIREGIVRVNSQGGDFVSLTVAEGDDVANMLRDGEDNSHTKWTARKMKDHGWPGAAADVITHDFQKGGRVLHDILTGADEKEEDTGLSRVFGMPQQDSPPRVRAKQKGVGELVAPTPDPDPNPNPPPEPGISPDALFDVQRIAADADSGWGVRIAYNDRGAERFSGDTTTHYLAFVYAVADGKPRWDHHSPADFDLLKSPIRATGCSVEAVASNAIRIDVESADFEVLVSGGFHADRMIRAAEVTVDDGADTAEEN